MQTKASKPIPWDDLNERDPVVVVYEGGKQREEGAFLEIAKGGPGAMVEGYAILLLTNHDGWPGLSAIPTRLKPEVFYRRDGVEVGK